jgi:hypothetical protein
VPNKKISRRKALIAIVFAGGMLNSEQLPVYSQSKSKSSELTMQRIANESGLSTSNRAYDLLRLANAYLTERSRVKVEAEFRSVSSHESTNLEFGTPKTQDILVSWLDDLSSAAKFINSGESPIASQQSPASSLSNANAALADKAIHMALLQLDHSADRFAQLNLYLIASRLYQKTGNTEGKQKCDQFLEKAIQACERNQHVHEDQIKAVSSVLNSMANVFIPVRIPDKNPNNGCGWMPIPVKPFTANEFRNSEKLKLRALALADRLNTQSDLRRRSHRNLSLWYKQLGKVELAEREKQTLFALVGFKDDRILYAQGTMCGHLLWWQKESGIITIECGRG